MFSSFNYLQRSISGLAILFLVAVVLFPVWIEELPGEIGPYLQNNRGRFFVLLPPQPSVIGKEVKIDWLIAVLNVSTVLVFWTAFTIVLRGKVESIQEQISRARLPLAVVIGGIAPVPPFVVPRTYMPTLFFLFSAFADTGHVPSSSILVFSFLFWSAYSALAFALLWVFERINKPDIRDQEQR